MRRAHQWPYGGGAGRTKITIGFLRFSAAIEQRAVPRLFFRPNLKGELQPGTNAGFKIKVPYFPPAPGPPRSKAGWKRKKEARNPNVEKSGRSSCLPRSGKPKPPR